MNCSRTYLAALLVVAAPSAWCAPPKNVVLMVADGTGFNSLLSASMFRGKVGTEVFQRPGWVSGAVATYSLNLSSRPVGTGKQDPKVVYDPQRAYRYDLDWLTSTPTDSASAATAMATGVKTYNNAIGWSDLDRPLTNVHQIYKSLGKATGVVSTVPFSHATPAGMAAHNISRNNYQAIGREMVRQSGLDVIMGAGNPMFDGNGKRLAKPKKADYVGGWQTWFDLESGDTGYCLVQTKSQFQGLAEGKSLPRKVVGVAQVADTLQQGRASQDWNKDGKVDGEDTKLAPVGGDPKLASVPSLRTMSLGALNVLAQNKRGFFLMIEGGAVDWANHANQPGRMVEEADDFLRALEAVCSWVEKNGGWKQTLVIVTADHETGLALGPKVGGMPTQTPIAMGKGQMPKLSHNSGGHTNSLVPIYARGPGAERVRSLAKGTDPVRGKYIQNTDIFRLMIGK